MVGDELKIKHSANINGQEWSCTGQVFKIPDSELLNFTILIKLYYFRPLG